MIINGSIQTNLAVQVSRAATSMGQRPSNEPPASMQPSEAMKPQPLAAPLILNLPASLVADVSGIAKSQGTSIDVLIEHVLESFVALYRANAWTIEQ